jgi:hypothetical protein
MRAARTLLGRATRASSLEDAARGLRDFCRFGAVVERPVLPAVDRDVVMYIAYSLEFREPRLDASSLATYLHGVSVWHTAARSVTGLPLVNPVKTAVVRQAMRVARAYYKLQSRAMSPLSIAAWLRVYHVGFGSGRAGAHQRLAFVLCTFGPLRPGASARLRVFYRVAPGGAVEYGPESDVWVVRDDVAHPRPYVCIRVRPGMDKNVDGRRERVCFIPSVVLGVPVVSLLEGYLACSGPPSGAFLLQAPSGRCGHRSTPYGGHCRAFRAAYTRALPAGVVPSSRVGGGTPRKSLSQWLWDAGYAKRVIADVGGWRTREDAVDGYFRTQGPAVLRILERLSSVA